MTIQKIIQEDKDRIVYLFLDDSNEVQGINFHFGTTEDKNYQTIDTILTKEFKGQDGTQPLLTRIDNVVDWTNSILTKETKLKVELFGFKKHFDKECTLALDEWTQQGIDMPKLTLEYSGAKISLPMHAQLYDDFIEFLNQQIDNE